MASEAESAGPRVSVVTVDDQPVFRSAAREVIEATPGFDAVGEACSGEEALGVIDESEPQLVLVDVRMPGMDGIEAAQRIKAAHPEVVVALISIDPSSVSASALTCGAAAFVLKQDFKPSTLRGLWGVHGTGPRPGPG